MRAVTPSLLRSLLGGRVFSPNQTERSRVPSPDARSTTAAEPADPLLDEALSNVRCRQWARAQRALERLGGVNSLSEASVFLSEVRAVRRCLRQIEKRPREALLHLELGRLYFGLDLGNEALEVWTRATELQPDLALAHHFIGLEYLYRNNKAAARRYCERAHALDPSLPSFVELERQMERAESGA